MERKLGVVLGVLAAAAVVIVGAARGVPAVETFWRAVLAAAAGYLLGWLVFGKLGAAVMHEAAGSDVEPPEREPEEKIR
jgi:hypothetical protein